MAGRPVRKAKRARMERMFADPQFWEKIFDGYAEFGRLDQLAKEIDVPWRMLYNKIVSDPKLKEMYQQAKSAYAQMTVYEIDDIRKKLEMGQIDPASAKTVINAKQWVAEKYAPVDFGQQQNINMVVQDATQMHLNALQDRMKKTAINITPEPKKLDAEEL